MKWIKIKDLPKDTQLVGRQLKKNKMYIYSGWNKGFWCKKNKEDSQIHPIFFKNYDEVKEWEVEKTLQDIINK